MIPLLLIEQTFFAANILKLFEGAWVPLAIAGALALMMFTWVRGYRILLKITRRNEADLDWLVRKLEAKPPVRVPGTAVFLSSDVNAAPTALMHNLKHNRILHERNIVLSIRTEDTPRVPRHERVAIDRSSETLHQGRGVVRIHGNAQHSENHGKLPAQGSQHRYRRNVILPLPPLAAIDADGRKCRAGRKSCSSGWRARPRTRRHTSRSRPTAWLKSELRSQFSGLRRVGVGGRWRQPPQTSR